MNICLFIFYQVDKALQSMEEEAERIYKDERAMLLDDEAASTRDAMSALLVLCFSFGFGLI